MSGTNEKLLKDYMKKQLGTQFRPSKKVKDLFGVGRFPTFKKQYAGQFVFATSIKIKRGIESGEIITTTEIDQIIEDSYKSRQKHEEAKNARARERKKIKKAHDEEPKYTVFHDAGKFKTTYTKKPIDWNGVKKASNVIGGGVLLGPVGALAGYALTDNKPPEPKTKTAIVHKKHTYKDCHVEILEDRLKFSRKQSSWPVKFKEITSTVLIENKNRFEIKTDNGSILKFIGEKPWNVNYTKKLFNELESKFKDYQTTNKPQTLSEPANINMKKDLSKPTNSNTEKDPIEQIKKLNELKEAGLITDQEFKDKKKELLNRI